MVIGANADAVNLLTIVSLLFIDVEIILKACYYLIEMLRMEMVLMPISKIFSQSLVPMPML